MILPERVVELNGRAERPGRYVLYWMQASQRAACNHALAWAIGAANRRRLPVVTCFGLTDEYGEANERHYAFMLEGLAETGRSLERRGVRFVLRRGRPAAVAAELSAEAALVVTDMGYLRHQRAWRAALARRARCRVVRVESDAVVPVAAASDREEYAARTIRPKLRRQWDRWLVPLRSRRVRRDALGLDIGGEGAGDVEGLLRRLRIDRSVGRVRRFRGGTRQARRHLRRFLRGGLARYADERGEAGAGVESHMSPYLHFGQISPLEVALAVRCARGAPPAAVEAYLEELLVRRELAINFVWYNRRYDSWAALPAWARATLAAAACDRRDRVYTAAELAAGETHDPLWNAAMAEMRLTGKMHNTMRMYWGKKIIEWTPSPRAALRVMLALNNRFFLDGRDPCSYANVAWCFGKHDRPWGRRAIFGTVRYMSRDGLQRKHDMDGYVRRVARLAAAEGQAAGARQRECTA